MTAGALQRLFARTGGPDHYEEALSRMGVAFGEPTREAQQLWMAAASIHASLAVAESQRDLARAMRENAAATQAMADEMKLRRS